jgi:hypothetical protein
MVSFIRRKLFGDGASSLSLYHRFYRRHTYATCIRLTVSLLFQHITTARVHTIKKPGRPNHAVIFILFFFLQA